MYVQLSPFKSNLLDSKFCLCLNVLLSPTEILYKPILKIQLSRIITTQISHNSMLQHVAQSVYLEDVRSKTANYVPEKKDQTRRCFREATSWKETSIRVREFV